MGGGFHSRHYRTLWFNSAGSEEAEPKLRRRGRQTHAVSSSNSFCLVIWLQLRDCGLVKRRQEKWKIHVPLNTITSVNAAACLRQPFLMDCALLFLFFSFSLVCRLKRAQRFHFGTTAAEFGKKKLVMNLQWSQRGASCFLSLAFTLRSVQHNTKYRHWVYEIKSSRSETDRLVGEFYFQLVPL